MRRYSALDLILALVGGFELAVGVAGIGPHPSYAIGSGLLFIAVAAIQYRPAR